MMRMVDEKANAVLIRMFQREGVAHAEAFNQFMPLTIASIIISLIRLAIACRQLPSDALKKAKNPGFIVKQLIKREIKKGLSNKTHSHLRGPTLNAVMGMALETTEDEVATMFLEAQSV